MFAYYHGRSVNARVTALVIAAAFGFCTPSRAGSLTFNPNVHAMLTRNPTSDGEGTLSALMASPGTKGPTINDINGMNSGGFSYTDVLLKYTSVAADVGNTVTVDAWAIERGFSNTNGRFTTFVSLDGSLTVAGAAGWKANISAVTAWKGVTDTGAIASTGYLAANGNFAASSYYSTTGMNNNNTPNFFAANAGANQILIQTMAMFIKPSAAGQVFQFDFPGSVLSITSVPEPASAIPAATAILVGLGCAWRRRIAC